MLKFHQNYFIWTILLFLAEVIIALYINDSIIRPYGGDILVVILVYCCIRSFFNTTLYPTAIGVLLFAYLIETLQFFNFIEYLGLQDSKIAQLVLGNSFAWLDLVAYTLGILAVLIIEKQNQQSSMRLIRS